MLWENNLFNKFVNVNYEFVAHASKSPILSIYLLKAAVKNLYEHYLAL